jgi:hypothetical protein
MVPRRRVLDDALFQLEIVRQLQQLQERRVRRADPGYGANERSNEAIGNDDQAQEIVMSEAPWVFIAFPGRHFARRANLKGFTYYTSNNIPFQDFSREA